MQISDHQIGDQKPVGPQSSDGANDTGKDNQMVERGCWESDQQHASIKYHHAVPNIWTLSLVSWDNGINGGIVKKVDFGIIVCLSTE